MVDATSFWEPPLLVPSGWTEHAPFAAWLIAHTRPSTIVELGTHNGYSLFTFAQAAARLELGTRIWAVDTWRGDDQAGFYGEDVYAAVREFAQERWNGRIELVRRYFSEAVDQFADGSIDLLHIDGRHGYDDVREDWDLYRPKLSSHGVAIFHDTNEHQEGFGVHRFWSEVSVTRPSFEFHHGHGLGVLAVGDDVSPELLRFLLVAAQDPTSVRKAYAALGGAITQREQLLRQAEDDLHRARVAGVMAQGEIARLRNSEQGLRNELADIRSSTSWRLTSPLRALGGALRREGAPPS